MYETMEKILEWRDRKEALLKDRDIIYDLKTKKSKYANSINVIVDEDKSVRPIPRSFNIFLPVKDDIIDVILDVIVEQIEECDRAIDTLCLELRVLLQQKG